MGRKESGLFHMWNKGWRWGWLDFWFPGKKKEIRERDQGLVHG